MGENIADAPVPQPDLGHLLIAEAHNKLPEGGMAVIKALQQVIPVRHREPPLSSEVSILCQHGAGVIGSLPRQDVPIRIPSRPSDNRHDT